MIPGFDPNSTVLLQGEHPTRLYKVWYCVFLWILFKTWIQNNWMLKKMQTRPDALYTFVKAFKRNLNFVHNFFFLTLTTIEQKYMNIKEWDITVTYYIYITLQNKKVQIYLIYIYIKYIYMYINIYLCICYIYLLNIYL